MTLLRKFKAVAGLAILATLGGLVVFLESGQLEAMFPGFGMLISAAVMFGVKEGLPELEGYIREVFDLHVVGEDGEHISPDPNNAP